MKNALLELLLVYFVCIMPISAENKYIFNIDKIMTKKEQKQMGLTKFTPAERKTFENWLMKWTYAAIKAANNNMVKNYLGVNSTHWVSKNIDSGKFIELEDGSLWEVSSIDKIDSMLWLATEDIVVLESDNPYYPYILINKDTGEKVEAKLVSKR